MAPAPRPRAPLFYGWYVVLACGVVAVFAWGLGFYGLGVYLATLRRLHGWPTSLISLATTLYYVTGAASLVVAGGLIDRHGSRRVMTYGGIAMAAGVTALGWVREPWQLFCVYAVLASGWACLSGTAISGTLVPWFRRRQGLAVTLALTGASVGGMLVVPSLVFLTDRLGFRAASALAGTVAGAVVLGLVAAVIRRRPEDMGLTPDGAAEEVSAGAAAPAAPAARPTAQREWTRREALRAWGFWTIAVPFALALLAQVGFIIHQLSLLEPALGRTRGALVVSATTAAALVGRLGLGLTVDRLDARVVSALVFAVQGFGLATAAVMPSATGLVAGSLAFGLGVGNVITLPPLLVHREFGARSFATVYGLVGAATQLGVAVGPGLVGLLRDAFGGPGIALALLAGAQAAAVVVVLAGRGRPAP